jgi:hypothetical protein
MITFAMTIAETLAGLLAAFWMTAWIVQFILGDGDKSHHPRKLKKVKKTVD